MLPVLLAILWTCASNAADMTAADLFLAGKAAYETQDYERALKLLQQSFKLDPNPMDTSLYIGLAARKAGRSETAIMAFERMLIRDPDLPRVRHELASTFFQMGLYELAQKNLDGFLDRTDVPEPVRRDAEAMLQIIRRSERRHYFSGHLALSVSYDTNPLKAPTQSVTIPAFKLPLSVGDPSDVVMAQWLNLDHEFRPQKSRIGWVSRLTEYTDWYDDLDQQELGYCYLRSGPRFYFHRARLELQPSLAWLRKDKEDYQHSLGLEARFVYQATPDLWLDSALRVERRSYELRQDKRYDGVNTALKIGPVRRWNMNTTALYLTLENHDARNPSESYFRQGIEAMASRELNKRLTLYTQAGYEHSRYRETNATESTHVREDNTLSAKLGASIVLPKALTVDLSCRYVKTRSTVELREYDRILTSVALLYKF